MPAFLFKVFTTNLPDLQRIAGYAGVEKAIRRKTSRTNVGNNNSGTVYVKIVFTN